MTSRPQMPKPSRLGQIPVSWWISLLLVLGVFAVYWPVCDYSFLHYDDQVYVWRNPHVMAGLSWRGVVWAFTTFHAANWHPLTWLSLMLDSQVFGVHAGAYHTVNVLFHAANTVLLFWLLRWMTGATWRSGLVAALFGFHPLHVESVAWIAERKDVLSTFFFMLTLMAYTRYVQESRVQSPRSKVFYRLSLLLFALGLMSKPMLVTLPFVLLLLDFWPLNRIRIGEFGMRNVARLLVEKVPFFALSAAICVVTFLAQLIGKAVIPMTLRPMGTRIENVLISYAAYLEKMVWPHNLAVFYPFPPISASLVGASVFVLVLISVVVFLWRRQRPYLAMGWLWYLGTLVPVIGLVQVGDQSMADRYTYIPLIGVFIAVVWGAGDLWPRWRYRRTVLAVVSVVVLGACLWLTAVQVRYWRNDETLVHHSLAVTGDNADMEFILGNTLVDQGDLKAAVQHFADSVRLMPNSFPALHNLALAEFTLGKFDEAAGNCQTILKLYPQALEIRFALANIYAEQGKLAEATAEYRAILQRDRNHKFALNDRAWHLATAPDTPPEFKAFNCAYLAWLMATAPEAQLRNGAKAVEFATEACRLTNYKTTMYVGTLAAAYAEAGRFNDAVKTAQHAIALATAEKQNALAAQNRELLKLYQAHKAYHQSAEH